MAVATSPSRPTSRSSPSLRGAVLALFVASGAAGLIYQVVWSRELVLVFGNTTQAVATIVTAFMAGLGFGSLVGGRLAGTSRRRCACTAWSSWPWRPRPPCCRSPSPGWPSCTGACGPTWSSGRASWPASASVWPWRRSPRPPSSWG